MRLTKEQKSKLSKSVVLYYHAAQALGLKPELLLDIGFRGFRIVLAGQAYYFQGSETPFNNQVSSILAKNKYCLNQLLSKAGLPVPKARSVAGVEYHSEWVDQIATELKFPVVAKPTNISGLGKLVVCNIQTTDQLKAYLQKCFASNKIEVMSVEEMHCNLKEYRVTVFFGEVKGIAERIGAQITGDGLSTIEELINAYNKKSEQATLASDYPVGFIKVTDVELLQNLQSMGLCLQDKLEKNKKIQLINTCNVTRGGKAWPIDKNKIHPLNAALLKKAAQVLELNMVGFDLLCEDISIPFPSSSRGVILEANENPAASIMELDKTPMKESYSYQIMKKFKQRHPLAFLWRSVTG